MLLVMFSHCMLFYGNEMMFPEKAEFSSPTVIAICKVMDIILMASFVFCSGFLYAAGFAKNRTMTEEIRSRAKRLLIPYYLYGTFMLVPVYTFFDFSCYGRDRGTSLAQGCKNMLLGIFSDHLWFLWLLFWITLFFILIKPLLKGKGLMIAALLTFGFLLVVVFLLKDFPYFKLSQIAPYLFSYLSGIVFFYLDGRINKLPWIVILMTGALLFTVIIVYCIFKPDSYPLFIVMKTIGGIMPYFIFLAVSKTGADKPVTVGKIYKYLEEHCLHMYLWSMPFIYFYFRKLYPLIGRNTALCILMNMIFSTGSVIVVIYFQEKVISLWTKMQKNRKTGKNAQ